MVSQKIVSLCKSVLDLQEAHLGEEYFYQSLPLCIIDAVFSISARYASTRNAVIRYCEFLGLKRLRDCPAALPAENAQHTISQMIETFGKYNPVEMAAQIFKNRQRTSSRSGILKAEAVYQWALILQKANIEIMQDMAHPLPGFVEASIKSIKGQGSGISLDYFYMLCGNDSFIKPDRHILTFFGLDLQKDSSLLEAKELLRAAAQELKPEFPHMTPRLLDHCIWNYMAKQ